MCCVERGLRREKLTFTTVDVVERQESFPCSGCEFLLIFKLTQNPLALSQGCMEDASDTRIQVNLILVELCGKYVPVHYLGVVSLGLDWQLNGS
jgi:hypothetical protein